MQSHCISITIRVNFKLDKFLPHGNWNIYNLFIGENLKQKKCKRTLYFHYQLYMKTI